MDMQILAGAMVSLVWIGLLVSHIVDTRSRQDAERLILQPPVADARYFGIQTVRIHICRTLRELS